MGGTGPEISRSDLAGNIFNRTFAEKFLRRPHEKNFKETLP
jgi:hypothetical protein